jgi:EAL domain-containing protein (putative c-di-GMP-specific phosphodiesterase class I)
VPVAEETGIIVGIGEWALREACAQLRTWQRALLPELTMSVNLSARQFLQPDLVARVQSALAESGVEPSRLHLEITESVIMENSAQAAAMMRQLKEAGVGVHLDDFGTGYSSLAYLSHFQVDALKIDRSFVARMGQGDGTRIVRAIVNLARDLGIPVVAEGTESSAQVKELCELHCDYAQGYYFSPPLRAQEFEEMVSGKRPAREFRPA